MNNTTHPVTYRMLQARGAIPPLASVSCFGVVGSCWRRVIGRAEVAITLALHRSVPWDMVFVPSGTFSIGCDRHYPEEAPVYRVTVNGYWIDRTPITNPEFQRFVNATCHVTVAERMRPRRETVRRWSITCLLHHPAPKRTWV